MIQHVCYSRLTDFYILSQTDTVLENQTLHSSTCQDSPYLAPSPYPASHNQKTYPVWTKVNQWEKEDKKQNCKSWVLPQYPHSSFIKNYYLREFDKKSLKHCPSGDHLINFHNLSPRLSNEIVWRKFMLLTWGLNGLRWNAFVHQTIL